MTLRKGQHNSVTDYLKELHWLLIKQRVEFKILTFTYKCLHRQGPAYLCDLIQRTQAPWQGLHLTKLDLLVIP